MLCKFKDIFEHIFGVDADLKFYGSIVCGTSENGFKYYLFIRHSLH